VEALIPSKNVVETGVSDKKNMILRENEFYGAWTGKEDYGKIVL
jgi:hypothetical protein